MATNLPPIVVEASRLEDGKFEVASHVDIISKGEIDSSGALSVVDLLEKRGNIFFRKMNANPALAQVSMRGFGANGFGRVKIVVDGQAINNPDMEAQNLLCLPLRSVENVEILHGPQTTLFGGDASAGAINIETSASRQGSERTLMEMHGGSWDSLGMHFSHRGELEEEALSYFGDFSWNRSDGYRDNGGFETWSSNGGLIKRFANGSRISVRSFWADSQYGLPEGIYAGKASYGVDYGDWRTSPRDSTGIESARNWTYGASLAAKGVVDDENALEGTFSFRQRKSTGYSVYEVDTADLRLKYANDSRLGGFENRFVAGGDAKLDLVDAQALAANQFSRFTGGVFVRDEFFVFENLSLFAGARGESFLSRDRYRVDALQGTDSEAKGAVGGEAGVNFKPCESTKLFVRWAPFFHAPLADEMFSAYGVANLDLAPEHGQTFEAGIAVELAEEMNFDFTAHHSLLTDEIAYFNYANVNLDDDTARTGFELSLDWAREKTASAAVSYAYDEGRFAGGANKGNLVPLVPRQRLRLCAEIFLADIFAVNGGCRIVDKQRYGGDFSGRGGMMPRYAVFDAGARCLPEWKWLKGFVFAFTVDNLFDRRYCDYGEYFDPWYVYPAAGRSVMFSVRYEF